MELKGTVEAIEKWERIPKRLVRIGKAELVKDTSKSFKLPFTQSDGKSLVSCRVYNILVGSGAYLDLKRVKARFIFDKRPGAKSVFRMSEEGLELLLSSITVVNLSQKLNIKIATKNGFDLARFEEVMEKALELLDIEEKSKEVKV